VPSNLAGFAAGFDGAVRSMESGFRLTDASGQLPAISPAGPRGEELAKAIERGLPPECRSIALHGALRALSYQDRDYGWLYLDRLMRMHGADQSAAGANCGFRLTNTLARELALQMCYEDTIRVAEIKTQSGRLAGIGQDIGAADGQPYYVREYFHPRYEEFCDTLPAKLGKRALLSTRLRRLTSPFFRSGRTVTTNKIGGFVFLSLLARLRRWRRATYRYATQQRHVEGWLKAVQKAVALDYEAAVALAESVQIVRGYGDTYERGLQRFRRTLAAAEEIDGAGRAEALRRLRTAALADEEGTAFDAVLAELRR
jgi:indolepyruvate ferredoxin oxidoreductase beta subunit